MRQLELTACCLAAILLSGFNSAMAQTPVTGAITYQGQLKEAGVPANGEYDFEFSLWQDPVSEDLGDRIGAVGLRCDYMVVDGLISTRLNFGAGSFDGSERWLRIRMRASDQVGCDAGVYTDLLPRQPLDAAPYALYALSGPGGGQWTLNGSDIYSNNSGNVGIGTTTPGDELHIFGDGATLRIQDDDELDSYLALSDVWSGGAQLKKVRATSGTTLLDIDASPQDGVSSSWIRFFRDTNTSGAKQVRFYKGDGTTTSSANIGVNGVASWFQLQGGNFGIGMTDPQERLHVDGNVRVDGSLASLNASADASVALNWSTDAGGTDMARIRIGGSGPGATNGLDIQRTADVSLMRITNAGNVGLGTTSPIARLHASASSGQLAQFNQFGNDPGVVITSLSSSTNFPALSVNGFSDNAPALSVNGTVSVDVLEIYGADVAEKFPASEAIEPGTVVEIDRDNPGELRVARGAYNRRVAGVASGAGDIPAGTILGNMPGSEDAPAIALSGRVWVYCDATQTTIEPGDMLTTSDTPGHAMKVTDYSRAHGAVIGKAMTRLDQGETGLVLVLVNLQ